MTRRGAILGVAATIAAPAIAGANATPLEIPSLAMPSLGFFPAPVIKAKGFDRASGLDVTFVPKAAAIYRTDFASGASPLGGSGSLLVDVGLVNDKGSKVIYLFNTNDYWGTVAVRRDSGIARLNDLAGKTLAAAIPTSNYTIFRYFAKLAGLDLAQVEVQNASQSALVTMMSTGRVDAVQLWEPAFSILNNGGDQYRALDFIDLWKRTTKQSYIPYQGIAAHADWVAANRPLIPRLYDMYEKAIDFIEANPDEAGAIIGAESRINPKIVADMIRAKRLGFRLYWGGEQRDAAKAMFTAAIDLGYLRKMPPDDIFFDKP
jgi:ABC-type nitrate/sulfonate/bicarbonate transport system substrate-binding protein